MYDVQAETMDEVSERHDNHQTLIVIPCRFYSSLTLTLPHARPRHLLALYSTDR